MEEYLKIFSSELDRAAWAFYAHVTLNNEALADDGTYVALYRYGGLWNTVHTALRTEFVIAMGRIFDGDDRSLSVFKLLHKCVENMNQFSLESLRLRKEKESENAADWIGEYIDKAYRPSKRDFEILHQKAEDVHNKYIGGVGKIRNKLVAHADEKTVLSREKLIGGEIDEIGRMLNDIYSIYRIVWQYYHNGRKCEFGEHIYDAESRVAAEVRQLMSDFREKRTPTEQGGME